MALPHSLPIGPEPTLDAAVTALRDRGLRVSSARRLVLEALSRASGPITADSIAGGLSGRLPRSDLASVYRNLETLEQIGLVRRLHLGHGPALYGMAAEQHDYLVCESCRRLTTVDSARLDGVRAAIRQAFGFRACFDQFPIVGMCPSCESGEAVADSVGE